MNKPRQYCPRCDDLKPKGYGRTTCDICFDEVRDETEEEMELREREDIINEANQSKYFQGH